MDKSNKSQIILLDKSGLETVAKALSSGCWALSDAGNLEIVTSSPSSGSSPQLTLAQGNVRPVTQVSGSGGSANTTTPSMPSAPLERGSTFQRDNSQVATLTELGKKLILAAKDGNTDQVRRLMAIGAPFAADGPVGMTPLHLAAQNGHYSTCDRLLCAGMNKNAKNKVDKTPLHLAAMEGHYNIVLLLVRHRASVNVCDMLKMTALHWACDRGHYNIAQLLLKHHAQTDIKNKFSKTPLQLAIENGHMDIILLLERGAASAKKGEGVEDEEEGGGEDEGQNEDGIGVDDLGVESISLGESLDPCTNIPSVVQIEEVHTEELLVPQQMTETEVSNEGSKSSKEEDDPSVASDLPHTILADDLEDQNISVLATLAELAHSIPRTSQTTVDMSSAAALELLKAQAALLDDSPTLVTSAVAHGQTLHLTEAGRQALKLVKQEFPLLPANTLPKDLPPPPQVSKVKDKQEDVNGKRNGDRTLMSSKGASELSTSSPSSSSLSEKLAEAASRLPALLPATTVTAPLTTTTTTTTAPATTVTPTDVGEEEGREEEEESDEQEVTQVITLSQEQYAALTGGTNGPIILQVVPSCESEEEEGDGVVKVGSPPPAKRQKVMQLVTKVANTTLPGHTRPIAKVSGEELRVDLPGVTAVPTPVSHT